MPFQVCRVCYKTGHDFLSLNEESNSYSTKLAACVPEIDIYIIDNPGLCEKCVSMLDVAYEFRETCLKNEKRYNDTFNRNVTPPRRNATANETAQNVNVLAQNIVNNSEATTSQVHQNAVAEVVDVDAETPPESNKKWVCTICEKEFKSDHDKKRHEHKLHKRIKYMNKFSKLVTPIITQFQQINPIIVFENEEIGQSSKKDDVVNNNTDNSNNKNNNSNETTIQVTEITNDDNLGNENQIFKCKKCDMTFTDPCEYESHNLIHVPNLCDICGKSFSTRVSLEAHKKLHNATCCGEYFSTPTLLQLHTYKEHNNGCGICNQVFKDFSLLFHHLLDHMGEFHCNLCMKKFTSKVYLEKHTCNLKKINDEADITSTTQRKQPKVVRCAKCDIEFDTRAEFAYHFRSVHKFGTALKRAKNIKCTKCYMKFETRQKFWQHFYKEHYDELKSKNNVGSSTPQPFSQYECAVCYKSYDTHFKLQVHITKVHCIKEISVPIVDVRKDAIYRAFYRDQEGLRINFTIPPQQSQINKIENFGTLKQELSNRSKKICFCCRLMFNNRIDLYKHLQKCHRVCCTNRFENLGMLVAHNFVHYKETEKEGTHDEITCLQCHNVYRNYKSLLAHTCGRKNNVKKSHTVVKQEVEKIVTVPEVQKKQLCTIEDHESDSSDSIVNTTNNYEGPRLMECEMCKSQFDSSASLLIHVRTTHI